MRSSGSHPRKPFRRSLRSTRRVLGVFVPSGGSKWVIEAPYVMAAAHELKVHLGWVVAAYDLGEALANLVQPFWMLPILGLFQPPRARRHGLHLRRFSRARPRGAAARDDPRGDAVLSAVAKPARSESYTIGRKRPTISCKRPVIWPNEQTSTASNKAGKRVFAAFNYRAQFIEARFDFLRVFLFELLQPIDLQFLSSRGACGPVRFPASHPRRCDSDSVQQSVACRRKFVVRNDAPHFESDCADNDSPLRAITPPSDSISRNSSRIAFSTARSTAFMPGEPLNMFMVCLKIPDSSRRIACPCAARRIHSSLGVVNGSSALFEWHEFVPFM